MEDSIIIWKFLNLNYLDSHQAVYLYCCGNVRSPKNAVEQIYVTTKVVFRDGMSEVLIRKVIIAFLENKKKLYIKGLIRIKPIYSNSGWAKY